MTYETFDLIEDTILELTRIAHECRDYAKALDPSDELQAVDYENAMMNAKDAIRVREVLKAVAFSNLD